MQQLPQYQPDHHHKQLTNNPTCLQMFSSNARKRTRPSRRDPATTPTSKAISRPLSLPPSLPSLSPVSSGKTVTIINRSEIVGRPLAAMLANDGATIYSIDVDSIFMFKRGALRKTEATPEEAVRQSDVVVTVRSRSRAAVVVVALASGCALNVLRACA